MVACGGMDDAKRRTPAGGASRARGRRSRGAEGAPGLETVGPYAFGGKLRHAFTAHPKLDVQTGELLFFGYNPVAPPYVRLNAPGVVGKSRFVVVPATYAFPEASTAIAFAPSPSNGPPP